MALKAPLTWNDNLPTEDAGSPGPTYSRVDTDGIAGGGALVARGLSNVAEGLGSVAGAIEKAEDRANKAFALDRSVQFDKKVNEVLTAFQQKEGLDAVSAQAKASAALYDLRTQMAGEMPNRMAGDAFLERTAEKVVGIDRSMQVHAANQYQSWMDTRFKAKQLELLQTVRLTASAKDGTRELALREIADTAAEKAQYHGITDATTVGRLRTAAVAEGVAEVVDELIDRKDANTLLGLLQSLKKDEKNNGPEVLAAMGVMKPEVMRAAQAFVLQEKTIRTATDVLGSSRLMGVGPNGEKVPYSANTKDFGAAINKVNLLFKSGVISSGMEYMETLEKVKAMAGVYQAARTQDIVVRSDAVYRAYDTAIQNGASPSAAMNDALKGSGLKAYQYLVGESPQLAYKIWATLLDRARTHERLGASVRSASQLAARDRFNRMLDKDVSLLTDPKRKEELFTIVAQLHPSDQNGVASYQSQVIKAIRNGQMVPKDSSRIMLEAARNWDSSRYTGDNPQTWVDEEAKAAYYNMQTEVMNWIREYPNQEEHAGRFPSEAEIRVRAVQYLNKVDPPGAGFGAKGRKAYLPGLRLDAAAFAGNNSYQYINEAISDDPKMAQARGEFFKVNTDVLLRDYPGINKAYVKAQKKGPEHAQKFYKQIIEPRVQKQWERLLLERPGAPVGYGDPSGLGVASPGMPPTALDEAYGLTTSAPVDVGSESSDILDAGSWTGGE